MSQPMSRTIEIVERQYDNRIHDEHIKVVPALDFVNQTPDRVPLYIEMAMEWAILGGD